MSFKNAVDPRVRLATCGVSINAAVSFSLVTFKGISVAKVSRVRGSCRRDHDVKKFTLIM